MEFDEIRKIWDSQNNKPMYVIDENSIHNIVKRKIKAAARKANTFEFGIIMITAFVTVFMITKGIMNMQWTNFLTAIASSGITIYIFINRSRRRKMENKFGQTLLDGLDNAIANIDYLIKQASTFLWWYILPFGIATMVSMYVKPRPIEAWLLIGAAFVLAYLLANWSARKEHLPRKKTLEALRRTLTQDQDYSDMR